MLFSVFKMCIHIIRLLDTPLDSDLEVIVLQSRSAWTHYDHDQLSSTLCFVRSSEEPCNCVFNVWRKQEYHWPFTQVQQCQHCIPIELGHTDIIKLDPCMRSNHGLHLIYLAQPWMYGVNSNTILITWFFLYSAYINTTVYEYIHETAGWHNIA